MERSHRETAMSAARTLADVGVADLPRPVRVPSRADPRGQPTVARVSVEASVAREFEADWVDRLLQVLHAHRDDVGTKALKREVGACVEALDASMVEITLDYPFFVEKQTPRTGQRCLVKHDCTYSVVALSPDATPRVFFAIAIPCITTGPSSGRRRGGASLGQSSTVTLRTESQRDIYPEDLVALVDRNALVPLYSFLAPEDRADVLQRIRTGWRTSVEMVGRIRSELAGDPGLGYFSVQCRDSSILHPYHTTVGQVMGPRKPRGPWIEEEEK
jgi:GTP cyclohydrolase IB